MLTAGPLGVRENNPRPQDAALSSKKADQSRLQSELAAAQRSLSDASSKQRAAEAAAAAAAERAAAAEERLSAASTAAAAAAAELNGFKAAAAKKLADVEGQLAAAAEAAKKAAEEKEAAEAGAARARSEMGTERAKASRLQVRRGAVERACAAAKRLALGRGLTLSGRCAHSTRHTAHPDPHDARQPPATSFPLQNNSTPL